MKTSKLFAAILPLIVLSSVAPALRAVDASATLPVGASERRATVGERLKELADKLGLTDAQKEQIKPIIQDEAQAMKELWEDNSIDGAAKRAQMMEIRKAHREQIAAILTPEQQAKLKDIREQRVPAPDGKKAADHPEFRGPMDGAMATLTPDEKKTMMEAFQQLQQDTEITELNNQFKALNEKREKLVADKLQEINPEAATIFSKMKAQREKMMAERKAQMELQSKDQPQNPAL